MQIEQPRASKTAREIGLKCFKKKMSPILATWIFFAIFSKFAIKNFQDVRHIIIMSLLIINYFWGGFFCGVKEKTQEGPKDRNLMCVRCCLMLCMQMML